MKASRKEIEISASILIALIAVAGGFMNGLLGAGGGIIMGIALSPLAERKGIGITDKRDIYANAQVSLVSISAVSLAIHSATYPATDHFWVVIPAALGGVLGSLLLRRMSSRAVGRIFSIIVIWSGIKMLF